jgi:hypothetical protein
LNAYALNKGRLPPAVVYGKNCEPLYSWRVLLLPYLEEGKLYDEFHLDEPWDSPHNIQLLPRIPYAYVPPAGRARRMPPHHTVIHVFVGKGAAFEGRQGVPFSDFSDGTSQTLLVVEAGEPVPWTKPGDIPFDADGPLPDLRGLFDFGFRAAMGDGSNRDIRKEMSEKTLQALITRNGHDKPGPDW